MIENGSYIENAAGAGRYSPSNCGKAQKQASEDNNCMGKAEEAVRREDKSCQGDIMRREEKNWKQESNDREKGWKEYREEQRRKERVEEKEAQERRFRKKLRKKKQMEDMWSQKNEERKARNRELLAKDDKRQAMNRKLLKRSIDSKEQYRKLCLEKAEQQELLKAALIRRYHERFLFADKDKAPVSMDNLKAPLYMDKGARCYKNAVLVSSASVSSEPPVSASASSMDNSGLA